MRKITLFITLMLCSWGISAKTYQVGDIVSQGTWNALVIYVDQSGEHGLLMSPTALRFGTLAYKLAIKKSGLSEEDFAAQSTLPIMAAGLGDEKIRKIQKAMLQENLNGTKGTENCQNIADYCASNGLPIDAYFPEVHWASQLGEGWFIPGMEELEIYANVIAQGVGKKNYKGNYLHADDKRMELNRHLIETNVSTEGVKKPEFNKDIMNAYFQTVGNLLFPQYLGSSTFANNQTFEKDPINKDKIAKINGLSIAGNINYIYFGLALFQNGYGQKWYVFNKKGVDYQQYTNAFKWF